MFPEQCHGAEAAVALYGPLPPAGRLLHQLLQFEDIAVRVAPVGGADSAKILGWRMKAHAGGE